MTDTMTRSLIETLVRSRLYALKKSPKRTTRNLIDMALQFSHGRFQKHFFEIAQEMLQNKLSPYYELIYRTVSNVDTEHLLNFGMNVGYNSFTYGANIIRQLETENGYNIPWNISLHLSESAEAAQGEHYHKLLNEGKSLGIYTWSLFSSGQLKHLLPVMEMNTDCAFILFCSPKEITEELLNCTQELNNIMFVIEYQDNISDTFALLKERQLLYSVYKIYTPADVPSILNGEIIKSINKTESVFMFLLSDDSCTEDEKKQVSHYVLKNRENPSFPVLPFEFQFDNERIDSIISDDSCAAWFDPNGYLCTPQTNGKRSDQFNYYKNNLSDIFKEAFPK